MKTLKNHYDNFCLGLGPRTQAGLLISGPVIVVAGFVLSFFVKGPAGFPLESWNNLSIGMGFLAAMPTMVTGAHAGTLRERARWVAYQNRDLEQWAKELVTKEPQIDVVQLQKTLDLRNLQTKCEEIENELEPKFLDMLEDEWSPAEMNALQRALDQKTGGGIELQ